MATKVRAAKKVGEYGVATLIVNGQTKGLLPHILLGDNPGGSLFLPKARRMNSRKHWIGYTLRARGAISLDQGAVDALTKRGKSLLASGIVTVTGSFEAGDPISCLDPDGKDMHADALHVIGRADDDGIAAYLRILPAGLSYPQASFGRVLTAPAYRGRGLGDPLVRIALEHIERRWPGSDVQIGAQAHLVHYYARHGFVRNSETYLDDGIPHIDMLRAAGAPR